MTEAMSKMKTMTFLAVIFAAGNLLYLPVIAWLGDSVAAEYRDSVINVSGLFKDGMLLILGVYFRDHVRGKDA